MAKTKEPKPYCDRLSSSLAEKIVKDPTRIVSPKGWSQYLPTRESIQRSERDYSLAGLMYNESDPHFVQILIRMPGFCSKALSKFQNREPKATVYVEYKAVPDWILESDKPQQKVYKMKWAGKSALNGVSDEAI